MTDDEEPPEENGDSDRSGPLSSLSPGVRLAIAGIGVIFGVVLIFVGLRSMAPDTRDDIPSSAILPTETTTP